MKYFAFLISIVLWSCSANPAGQNESTRHPVEDQNSDFETNHNDYEEVDQPQPHKLSVSVKPTLHLKSQGSNSYEASNLIDGDPATAWAISLTDGGVDADVIDLLEFDVNADKIDCVVITNGYAKNKASYENNARGRTVLISRVPWEEVTDSDIIYYGPLKDAMHPQQLRVSEKYDNSRPTPQVYVMFESDYYSGAKYTDFCISEIEFYGY